MLSLRVALKTAKHVELELFVTLRVVDRVALTARQTLADRLGYGDILADLKRQDYYRVAVAGEEAEALAYLRDIAESTTLFANPNKETFTVQTVERPLSKDDSYVALVYPREGLFDESLCRHLALELGFDGVVAAGRGVAWTIELARGADPKYVEEILVARERSRGLLANPHAENYEIV
jgi:phosphoribosylformylglycinamidine (FGAM) synthase PurS component